MVPEGIVLHKISGKYAFPDDPFNTSRIITEILIPYKVSYNIMIGRDGEPIRLVPEGAIAYHAGKSIYNSKNYCNNFMLGVGLVSTGEDYKAVQIDTLAKIIIKVGGANEFGIDSVTTHEKVRNTWNRAYPDNPGDSREGDPGEAFPWHTLRLAVKEVI